MEKEPQRTKKFPLWEMLTCLAAIAGVICSIIFYLDGKKSTENKIVEALSDRYESVDREMSYEQALEAVDRDIAKLKLEYDSLESENIDLHGTIDLLHNNIDSLQDEMVSLKAEIDLSKEIDRAESYAILGDYAVAIPILNRISEKTDDVIALIKNYTTNYEISVITEAELLASNWNFDQAVSLIDEALEVIPNSRVLLDKKKDITPQYLVDTIECYKAENLWLLDNREHIKMSGKNYRHAIYSQQADAVESMFNHSYTANAFYNLDGKYNQLSGVVGNIDFSGSGTIGMQDGGQVYDAELVIWGDGQEMASISLSSDDAAKNFNISISDVKILEFQIKCGGNSKVGIAEIQIR